VRVIAPMLAGERVAMDVLDDDVSYAVGLGLIRVVKGQYEIANPIYREVIPRALTLVQQRSLHQPTEWYVLPDGSLDVTKIMEAWQEFWREDGHLAADGFQYREAGPHLMLMAFLQRIINGGGRIEREYGLGRGALDLLIFFGKDRHLVEVKLRRDARTEKKAVAQVLDYLDRAGMKEGWIVLFDLRKGIPWGKKLFHRRVRKEGKRVHVIGC
jgi:hypothetical protein